MIAIRDVNGFDGLGLGTELFMIVILLSVIIILLIAIGALAASILARLKDK